MKSLSVVTDFHADRGTDERKDRHDEVNSRFSQFCEPIYNN